MPVTTPGTGCIPDHRNYTVRRTCARVVHREPETGSIAAGYLFNDIARAYIDLFAKILITALDANEWRRMAGQRSLRLAKAMRDRSFSQDDDYILMLAAQRPLNRAGAISYVSSLPAFQSPF